MNNYDIFCYGEIGVDNIIQVAHLPNPELAVFPTADTYHIGGAAANTAVWMAKFGFRVGLSGNSIGFDEYGRDLWEWLSRHPSLDLKYVEQNKDVLTPFCRAMVTPDAERSFLVYWYPQTPKSALTEEMLYGVSFLALDLYGGNERVEAARLGRNAGVHTVIGDVIQLDHPVLPFTSIATNSAAFIRDSMPGVDVREHSYRLQSISKGIVVTTDGAGEIFVIDRDGSAFTVQPPKVTPVDATGAGDAFRSGLLAGLLRGESLMTSACLGVAAGALKVQHLGAATHVPELDEVIKLAGSLSPVEYQGS